MSASNQVQVTCAKCGQYLLIDPASKGNCFECPSCQTQFFVPQVVPPRPPPVPSTQAPVSLCCPKCGSTETQSLTIVYSAGTSSSSALGLGTLFGSVLGSNLAGGVAHQMSQSGLAKLAAPPRKLSNPYRKQWLLWSVVLLFAATPIGIVAKSAEQSNPPLHAALSAVMLLVIIGGCLLIRLLLWPSWKHWLALNERNHMTEMERWRNTVLCHRCGNTFVPAQGSS